MSKGCLNSYLESIVEIIEEKPLFEIPRSVFKAVIFVSFFQVGAYILEESAERNLNNEIISSIHNILQLISLNRILVLQDSDIISLIVFFFILVFIFVYFLYVGGITLLKKYYPQRYESYKKKIISINQFINIYFSLNVNILLNFQIELSSSIMYCNPRGLLSKDRFTFDQISDSSFICPVQTWQVILGVTGIITSCFIAIIGLFFFRNFEFHEQNMMKRRISSLFMIAVMLKILSTFIEHSSIQQYSLLGAKHALLQFYGLISIFDSCWNNPYSDNGIAKFNLVVSCCFYCLVSICNLWVYTSYIYDNEIFYFYLAVIVFISGFFNGQYNMTYEIYQEADLFHEIEKMKNSSIRQFSFDFYLEEWAKLAQISSKNEEAKFKVQRIFRSHIATCKNEECPCAKNQILNKTNNLKKLNSNQNNQNGQNIKNSIMMKDNNNEIDLQMVYNIINCLFKWLLDQKSIQENTREFEHLSLKYITFMIKCLKNQPKANYQLKMIFQWRIQRGGTFSMYFQILSKIITSKMENSISGMNDQFLISKRKEELSIYHITTSDNLSAEFLPIFQSVLKEKQLMWTRLQVGYRTMNEFQYDALKLMNIVSKVKNNYLLKLESLQKQLDFNFCLVSKKLSLIFYLFVLNDNLKASQLEQEVIDLRKRDSFLEEDILTNENLIKKNTVQIVISISQSLGKITSKKDYKTAEFFGYSQQEFSKIVKVNDLMPQFLSSQHDSFLTVFINKGYSKIIKSHLPTFAKNKKGFIFSIKLYPDFQFGIADDFRVSGTLLKTDKSSEYILFDRSGKILGISEKIAELLLIKSRLMSELPQSEVLLKSLHALFLFPHIIKKLIYKKQDIIDSASKQNSEIILTDDKGEISFDKNIFTNFREFCNTTDLKGRFQSTETALKKQKNHSTGLSAVTSQSTSTIPQEILAYDVLSSQTYNKFRLFLKLKDKQQSQTSNSAKRKFRDIISMTKKAGESFKEVSQQKVIYKISFKYSVSFFSIENESESNDTNQTNQSETSNFFFVLKMRDLQLSQKNEQLSGVLQKYSFPERIANYLSSISCLPVLKSILNPEYNSKQSESQDEEKQYQQSSLSNQIISQHNPQTFKRIPKPLLAYLKDENKNQAFKKMKSFNKNIKESSSPSKYDLQSQDKFTDQFSNISSKSNQNSSDSSLDKMESDIMCTPSSITDQKNINGLFQYFQKIQGSELDKMLNSQNITIQDIIAIDPYYIARRVIQKRTLSNKFAIALETSIVKALIETYLENNDKLLNSQKNDIEIKKFESVENINNEKQWIEAKQNEKQKKEGSRREENVIGEQELTFRDTQKEIQGKQSFLPKQSRKSSIHDSQKQSANPITNSQKLEKQQTLFPMKGNFPYQITATQDLEYNNYVEESSHIQLIIDNSFRVSNIPSQLDLSNENITNSKIQNYQNSTYLNTLSIPYQSANNNKQLEIAEQIETPKSEENMHKNTQTNKTEQRYLKIDVINESQNQNLIRKSSVEQDDLFTMNKDKIKQNPANQQSSDLHFKNHKLKANQSDDTNQKILAQLLQQGGLLDEKGNEKLSVHSSSRSSSSYGGYFLKEIIKKHKVPKAANTLSLVLILFMLLFFGLNIANLLIIKSDMQYFTSNVVVLRPPRKLLRDFLKSSYGFFVDIQIQTKYFVDTNSKQYYSLTQKYLMDGAQSYNYIIEQNQNTLITYKQKQQNSGADQLITYKYFENFVEFDEEIDSSIFYDLPIYFLLGIQANSSTQRQSSSFLTLRSNIYTLQNDVTDFSSFLVKNVLDTADSLVLKFTFISIAAIISLFLIPMVSFPIAKRINLYEEKIMLVVSRISLDQSSIERQKLSICSQLLSLDTYEWLKYTYNEVFNLKFNQFDSSIAHSLHDMTNLPNNKKIGDPNFSKIQTIREQIKLKKNENPNQITSKNYLNSKIMNSKIKREHKIQRKNIVKQALEGNLSRITPGIQSTSENQFRSSAQKNYILQSKIVNQKLSVFLRVRFLLTLMVISVIYFLIIIVYINSNKSKLQEPIQINQQSDLMHINYGIYLISSELLAFDGYLSKTVWPEYSLNDLDNFFSSMNKNLDQLQERLNYLSNSIYGANPYPANVVQILKNFMEGNSCDFLINYPCDESQKAIPITSIVNSMKKIQTSFSDVLTPSMTEEKMLIEYLNSQERIKIFFEGFQQTEEILDQFSSYINTSIGIVSDNIQNFLEELLSICGNLIALVILVVLIYFWRSLYQNIQLMNLFLTFIPDEKLLEEVTLQMLKSLRKM